MSEQSTDLDREVEKTLRYWVGGVVNHNRAIIEHLHDDDFICTGLDAAPMDRATHVEMELDTKDVSIEFFNLINRDFGAYVITWGRQTLTANVPVSDFSAAFADGAAEGIELRFTLVWRRGAEGLRILTFHSSAC